MTTIPHEPSRLAEEDRRLRLLVPEMWASLAIIVMWMAVLLDAVFGPDIVSSTVGGTTSTVPSAVALAPFAFFGTWVVARHGFPRRSKN